MFSFFLLIQFFFTLTNETNELVGRRVMSWTECWINEIKIHRRSTFAYIPSHLLNEHRVNAKIGKKGKTCRRYPSHTAVNILSARFARFEVCDFSDCFMYFQHKTSSHSIHFGLHLNAQSNANDPVFFSLVFLTFLFVHCKYEKSQRKQTNKTKWNDYYKSFDLKQRKTQKKTHLGN